MERIVKIKKAFLVEINTGFLNPLTISVRLKEEYDLDILKDQIKTGRGFKPLGENRYYKLASNPINVLFSSEDGYVIDAFGDFSKFLKSKDIVGKRIKALHLVTETVFNQYSFSQAELFLEDWNLYLKLLNGIRRENFVLKLYKGNFLLVGKLIDEIIENGEKFYQTRQIACFRNFNPNQIEKVLRYAFLNAEKMGCYYSFIILLDEITDKVITPKTKSRLVSSMLPVLDIQLVEDSKTAEKVMKMMKKERRCFKFKTVEDLFEKIKV